MCKDNGYPVLGPTTNPTFFAPVQATNVLSGDNPLNMERYFYDIQGAVELFSKTSSASAAQQSEKAINNKTSIDKQYPSGMKVKYNRDDSGNIVNITLNGDNLIDHIQYQQAGKIKSWQFNHGQQRTIQYDKHNRIQAIFAEGIQDWQYQRDLANNLASNLTDNLTIRINRHNTDINSSRFHYDNKRLTSVNINGKTTEYKYNSQGQRIKKQLTSGDSIDYIYSDDGQLIAEFSQGIVLKEYIYLQGKLIALRQNGDNYQVFNDHLGRPSVVTDSQSDVVWQADYFGFKRVVTIDNINQLNIGLPGHYWDAEKASWSTAITGDHLNMDSDPQAILKAYIYSTAGSLPLGQGSTALDNLIHYILSSGTDKTWNFNHIDTSNVSVLDFEIINLMLRFNAPGKYIITPEIASVGLTLTGDDWLALGSIPLHLGGELKINANRSWEFEGALIARPDPYDFNRAQHRTLLGEACTIAGSLLPGKEYKVHFTGSKYMDERGR